MEYPFIKCLHPVKIWNKNTESYQVVPCCKCVACLNKRASRGKRLCELEALGEYNCTYFVTLTYDRNSLPVYELIESGTPNRYYILDKCERSENYGCLISNDVFYIPDNELFLLDKKNLHLNKNEFSYLHYRDIQLFNKSLRKYLDKKYNEKVRYYAVGEYTPTSLRAHWHIIYFAKQRIPELSSKRFLYSLWKKGIVDADRCKGGAVGYCAGYSNSAFALPSFFKALKISSFARHSTKLGFNYMQNALYSELDKVLHKSENRRAEIETYYPSGETFLRMPLDSTLQSALFARSYQFKSFITDKSAVQYFRVFTYYSRKFPDAETLKSLTESVFNYLLTNDLKDDLYSLRFRSLMNLHPLHYYENGLQKQTEFTRLYTFFRFSRSYVDRCNLDANYHRDLVKYYDLKDYRELCKQYERQEQLFNSVPFSLSALSNFYDSSYNYRELKELTLYQEFANNQQNIHEKKLLRKRLNDIAQVLNF